MGGLERVAAWFRPQPVRYAGIVVGLDRHWWHRLPVGNNRRRLSDLATYEAALLTGLDRAARPGDHIVIVGGGYGVTAVHAARRTGPGGRVTVYEGSGTSLAVMAGTIARNGLGGQITVEPRIVAVDISVYRGASTMPALPPADLPACDVLELDCEGAEIAILSGMTIRPRHILVETHGIHGAPTAQVAALLDRIGYDAEDLGVAEPDLDAFCRKHDIRVLHGRHRA